jgi:PleD family two-component response regulator
MHQRRLILLVDGQRRRAERLAHRLADLEFDVQVADNGATGLLKAHDRVPDVVITAAELDILDGYQMLDALRSKPQTRSIPVILVLEEGSRESLVRGWNSGADFCITRSQDEIESVATLRRALACVDLGPLSTPGLALAS